MLPQMPGAFPTTPSPRKQQMFHQQTPSAPIFEFNSHNSSNGPLYPTIVLSNDVPEDSFQEKVNHLGYSQRLSSNVMSELDQRAAIKKINLSSGGAFSTASNGHSNPSILSPSRGSRFNSSHKSRFQKMDSISSHYAATRSHRNEIEIEIDKENIPNFSPNSKRNGLTDMSSAAKRRKNQFGSFQEIYDANALYNSTSPTKQATHTTVSPTKQATRTTISPSKRFSNLNALVTGEHSTADCTNSRNMSSTLPKSSSKLPRSTTSSYLQPTKSTLIKSASRYNMETVPAKQAHPAMTRSSTMANLTKPTASSLSKSKQPLTSFGSNTSSIPRSTSTLPGSRKPVWR